MEQNTQTHTLQNILDSFGEYAFSESWITVTDPQGCITYVTKDDLISEEDFLENPSFYVPVTYYGQKFWISKDVHFPLGTTLTSFPIVMLQKIRVHIRACLDKQFG